MARNKVVQTTEEKEEKLSKEELSAIQQAKTKVVYLTTVAEKATAQARVAELEAQNLILSICNKYDLNLEGGDNITEEGVIKRAGKAE